MTNLSLDKVLTDEKLRNQLFPVTRYKTYLAHAAVCPLPFSVASAISSYAKRASQSGQFEYLHLEIEAQTRSMAAELIGAQPEEIAFVPSTSAGLSIVASGLNWRPGDSVVIADWDFPANTYPWLNLRRRGVQVKFIPRRASGLVTVADVADQIDHTTRLVSLSTVHFAAGSPIETDTIGAFLRERGILFCVDAIQSLGILPCSVKQVDFLAADAHKWLLGPQGIGILFVRQTNFDELHPALVGWRAARTGPEPNGHELILAESARRYEPGSPNALGLVGLHSAMSLIRAIGVNSISDRLMLLRSKLIQELTAKGYEVLGTLDSCLPTGITSFRHNHKPIPKLFDLLVAKGINLSLREDSRGQKCIRVSPHFYNTEDEIDFLLKNV